jgi:hypothetical protein
MATFYLPKIVAEQYDGFRRVLGRQLPATYMEWLSSVARQRAQHESGGHVVVDVDTDPNEFARYCAAPSQPKDLKTLGNFAFDKSQGNQY